MTIKKELLLGAHVSIAGGIENSIKEGTELGCTVIQIFTKNNRQWSFRVFSDDEIEVFRKAQQKSPIQIVVSHASYLINLGSSKKEVQDRSREALTAELTRCHQLKIPYLVLHPGSCLGLEEHCCIEQIANNLSRALEQADSNVIIALENMAGQGSSTGRTLEQLAAIRKAVTHKKHIGFCFDTCHGFAAGYDLRTEKSYRTFWTQFDTILGLENLKIMHLNDSKNKLDSHIDRHEDIGKGEIGLQTFRFIMNDSNLAKIPKIIETPKESLADHVRNLMVLRKLAE